MTHTPCLRPHYIYWRSRCGAIDINGGMRPDFELLGAFGDRQGDCEGRTLAALALKSNRAALRFNKCLRNRQAEPRATRRAPAIARESHKLVEYPCLVFGTNTNPGVSDANLDPVANLFS